MYIIILYIWRTALGKSGVRDPMRQLVDPRRSLCSLGMRVADVL